MDLLRKRVPRGGCLRSRERPQPLIPRDSKVLDPFWFIIESGARRATFAGSARFDVGPFLLRNSRFRAR
jgi:hypothetical protein